MSSLEWRRKYEKLTNETSSAGSMEQFKFQHSDCRQVILVVEL